MQYDFKSLSSYDFELLVRDLFQRNLSTTLETFKPGRDCGIDIRLTTNRHNTIIVQCKHYASSTYSDLYTSLVNERPKLNTLKPEKYYIATSLGLTPPNKDKIIELFEPFIKDQADIFDLDSLNNLLRKYPDIEKNHYKLWMSSTNVMRLILHNSIYNRSKIDQNSIQKKIKVYVQNPSYGKALKVLSKSHYCIISGNPGIGKTTLAEILCLKYLSIKYSLVSINTSINDAYSLLDDTTKQVFIFDDFLGSIFLENQIKDNALIKFIEHIENTKNKRFILTTREYILQQAIGSSEAYARAKLKKCIIKQEEYTRIIKAQILYNHLFFSGIKKEYIDSLITSKKYNEIINHTNYTPRLIEWMTNSLNVQNIKPDNYPIEFINALNNPRVIWKVAFEHHLSKYSRSILILLGMLFDTIVLEDFSVLFKKLYYKTENIVEWNILYKSSLKELEGTFIKIERHSTDILQFHNPSIKDFIMEYILNEHIYISDYFGKDLFYWDQYCSLISIIDISQNNDILPFIKCALEEMISKIDLPTIEIEHAFSDFMKKKEKTIFARLHFILKSVQKYKVSLSDELVNQICELVKYETAYKMIPNYDSWYVYMELIKIKGIDYFSKEKETIFSNLQTSQSHEDLKEYSDIYCLFEDYDDDYKDIVLERCNNILEEIYQYDDLSSLKKAEEDASELIDSLNLKRPIILDNLLEKIAEIENAENDDEEDYDDEARHSLIKDKKADIDEQTEIDDMFKNLLVL